MTGRTINWRRSSSKQSQGFSRLAKPIRHWIWTKRWKTLHTIQERAIATLLDDDRDLIIAAPTAGGKTEAAFFPLISLVLENPGSAGFDLVYVSPLKALINDQFGRLRDLCAHTHLPVYPWHGDVPHRIKARARDKPRGVLLITPESLEALFVRRGLEIPRLFICTRAIIIDELHALLDNERGIHLRSLLTRLELATGRRIRRVGLSATLGEMKLAREYLRPDDPDRVLVLEDKSESKEVKAQLRGYVRRGGQSESDDSDRRSAKGAVAKHLFDRLRGTRNLVFAGSRQRVEWYADALRELSERAHFPVEFFPHHASLSREHRMDLESRLSTHPATTAVCTSTLELGIDIGDIKCVAQIGPPFSVASLRQRLGRSGRRTGTAAILRMYQIETAPSTTSHPLDRLHLGLIRSIAMVELLAKGWCEPPLPQALHLSTLIHQILSVIAEHGGRSAICLYETLCKRGPFRCVDPPIFERVLRQLGRPDVALIEQAPDGALLLGREGERLVEHYSFYAVFQTPQEYRIVAGQKVLGTLPIVMVLMPGMTIVFSGRRWRITRIDDRERLIEVSADRVGRPPMFGGAGAAIHDRIAEKMCEVLMGTDDPVYLDTTALQLLAHARAEYRRLGFDRSSMCGIGQRHFLIATCRGTVKTSTLGLALLARDYQIMTYDGFLDVRWAKDVRPVTTVLEAIADSGSIKPDVVVSDDANLCTEKYHTYLSPELLLEDVASSRLDVDALPCLTRRLIGRSE